MRAKLVVGAATQIAGCLALLGLHASSPVWLLLIIGGVLGISQGLIGLGNQNALYAQAAEAILRRQGHDTKARVVGAGYYFATERGEGQRRLYPQDEHRRRALAEILDLLAEVARQGLFIPAKDSAVCRSCDFRDGCGAERAVRQIQEKRGAAEQLTLLRRLQRYG